jgi:hypothetical protein
MDWTSFIFFKIKYKIRGTTTLQRIIESNQKLILMGWYCTGVTVKKYTAPIHGMSKGCKI